MDYSPSRDIPKAVEEVKSLSPVKIVEWVRDNRTEKDALGKKHQVERSPQSVSMWFKEHPDIYQALEKKLDSELVAPQAISEDSLQNSHFQKLPCVQKWEYDMLGRKASEKSIGAFRRILAQICRGEFPRTQQQVKDKQPIERLEGWGLKHPARLTLEDCLRYNAECVKRKLKIRNHRLTMRNFLRSRNVEGWDKISGELEDSAGQYAHLYAPPEKLREMFAWLKGVNEEAHDAVMFAFKTGGTRLSASLNAEAKYVDRETSTITLFEKASLHKGTRRIKKVISPDLMEILEPRIERGGKLFNITETEVNALLRACYTECIPKLADDIPMPFHFWRHQFAQHGLRATGWNYGLIARLGGWTVETLERYYGRMDEKTAFDTAKKFLPAL